MRHYKATSVTLLIELATKSLTGWWMFQLWVITWMDVSEHFTEHYGTQTYDHCWRPLVLPQPLPEFPQLQSLTAHVQYLLEMKHDIKDYVEGLKVFWTDTKMWLHWQLAASRPEATESWFPGVGYQKYHGYDEVGRVHYKFCLQTTSQVLDTIIIHFIVTSVHALKSFQNTFLYPTLTMWMLWMTNTDLLQNRSVMSVHVLNVCLLETLSGMVCFS